MVYKRINSKVTVVNILHIMNINKILLIFVVICVILILWYCFSPREYFEPEDTLKFHRISTTETYSIKGDMIYPKLKAMTSMIETVDGILLTSKKGEIILQPKAATASYKILLDFSKTVDGFTDELEGGVMCIASDPYSSDFVISYTIIFEENGQTLVVQKGHLLGKSFELGTVWFQQNYPGGKIHHAGTLMYDQKGNLFLTLGDGGPQGDPENHAQNLKSYRGKLLCLGRSEADDPQIVAYGLRNPWRFDISERGTFIADVGHSTVESLYLLPNLYPQKPYNCGWNQYEGSVKYAKNPSFRFEETLPPIFEYHNEIGNPITPGRAIMGGFYLPQRAIYVFGDHMSKYLFILQEKGGKWLQVAKGKLNDMILSFGMVDGDIYALTFGGVYRITIESLN